MVKIKVCGITNLEDALAAIGAGCDALGFVFYKNSPRFINPQDARKIIKCLPKDILKVGVFVNATEKTLKYIAKLCNLDILQFHGAEAPGFCRRFTGYKVIKAFRIKDRIDLAKVVKYKTFAYLFDTFVKTKAGGTGRKFDWQVLKPLDNIKQPIFLSGGLNADNVREAIKIVKPDWVDVSSCVESRPGKKDPKKLKEFIQAVRRCTL